MRTPSRMPMFTSVERVDVPLDRPAPPAASHLDSSPLDRSLRGRPMREGRRTKMRTDGLRPIVEAVDREMARLYAKGDMGGAKPTALLDVVACLGESAPSRAG